MARAMKDSGIAWIGEIPEEWEVCPLKNVIQWKSEKNHEDSTVLSLYRDYGVIPKDSRDDNHNVTSLDTSGYKYVQPGDLVINKMKAWQGSIAVSDFEGIVSPAYHVCAITNPRINKRYLHHLLRNPAYLPEYLRLSTGMRVGQWDLGFDDFKNIPIVVPSLTDQERITHYIDQECTRIDAVIEQTRASIKEYNKLKQAVITQAVTKGIRPNRPMKDSGIDWIGTIPEEWITTKVKYVSSLVTDGAHVSPETENGIYCFVSTVNIDNGKIDFESCLKTSESSYASLVSTGCKPLAGDVLISKDGTVGKTAIVKEDREFVVASSLVIIRPQYDRIITEYLNYVLQSRIVQETLIVMMHGAGLKRVSVAKNANLLITLPPINEQRSIVEYLDEKTWKTNLLIQKKNQLMYNLETYKKSIIYEYVTGKQEVTT